MNIYTNVLHIYNQSVVFETNTEWLKSGTAMRNAHFKVQVHKLKTVFQVQVFDLWLTLVDIFLQSTTCMSSYPNNSDTLCYITDGITGTYCGIAPGFDLKAKFSLSESVELAPEGVKNNKDVSRIYNYIKE